MGAAREIKARDVVDDLVSGIDDHRLMNKYKLTFRGLQSLYRKLVEAKVIKPGPLQERILPQLNTETTIIARLPRKDVHMPLLVQDAANPGQEGLVTNITQRGLGIKGLDAEVDEVKQLLVEPGEFFQLRPFTVKSKCRWATSSSNPQEILAGFETVSIAHRERQKLRNLIEMLDYLQMKNP